MTNAITRGAALRAGFGALAAGALAPQAAVSAADLPILRLAGPANDSATSALWALHAGRFAQAGLDVRLQAMASGAAVTAAVAGGAVDVGLSSMITLIAAHAHGVPFQLIAPSGLMSSDYPYIGLIVRKDAAIASGRDLNGKVVASPALRDLNAIGAMAWIEATGGDLSTVRFVELPQPATLAAIEQGRVDASVIGTPTLTEAIESGKFHNVAYPFDSVAKRFEHIAWFTTADYAAKNGPPLERFARVMHAASLYVNAHPAETAPLVAQFDGIDPQIAARMIRVPFAEYLDSRLLQPLVDAAVRYKVIEKRFDAAELIGPIALKPPA